MKKKTKELIQLQLTAGEPPLAREAFASVIRDFETYEKAVEVLGSAWEDAHGDMDMYCANLRSIMSEELYGLNALAYEAMVDVPDLQAIANMYSFLKETVFEHFEWGELTEPYDFSSMIPLMNGELADNILLALTSEERYDDAYELCQHLMENQEDTNTSAYERVHRTYCALICMKGLQEEIEEEFELCAQEQMENPTYGWAVVREFQMFRSLNDTKSLKKLTKEIDRSFDTYQPYEASVELAHMMVLYYEDNHQWKKKEQYEEILSHMEEEFPEDDFDWDDEGLGMEFADMDEHDLEILEHVSGMLDSFAFETLNEEECFMIREGLMHFDALQGEGAQANEMIQEQIEEIMELGYTREEVIDMFSLIGVFNAMNAVKNHEHPDMMIIGWLMQIGELTDRSPEEIAKLNEFAKELQIPDSSMIN